MNEYCGRKTIVTKNIIMVQQSRFECTFLSVKLYQESFRITESQPDGFLLKVEMQTLLVITKVHHCCFS